MADAAKRVLIVGAGPACEAAIVATDRGHEVTGIEREPQTRGQLRPAHYQILIDGACGQLIRASGWHAWRPANIHIQASTPGF